MALPPTVEQLDAIERERSALQPEVSAHFHHRTPSEAPVPPGHVLLRRAPVWLCTTDIPLQGDFTSRTHTVCVVGDPGRGVYKSGLSYYSLRSDPKRSGLEVDSEFLTAVRQARDDAGMPAFAAPVVDTLEQMEGMSFITREAFCKTYLKRRQAQQTFPSEQQVMQEYRALSFQVAKHRWEVWPQPHDGLPPRKEAALKPDGEPSAPGSWGEQDVRKLEREPEGVDRRSGKAWSEMTPAERECGRTLEFDKVSMRVLPGVDPLGVLEAHRQILLQRLYTDELVGRNGTLQPMMATARSPQQMRTALSKVATYQLYPSYAPGKGNCNSATATFLKQAGARPDDIKSPSAENYGFRHVVPTWQPVPPSSTGGPSANTPPGVDACALRGAPVHTDVIEQALRAGPDERVLRSREQASGTNHG